jgi:hypothetical protein
MFQTMRLAARIKELRDRGHPIMTREVRLKSGKKVAQYRLAPRTR